MSVCIVSSPIETWQTEKEACYQEGGKADHHITIGTNDTGNMFLDAIPGCDSLAVLEFELSQYTE